MSHYLRWTIAVSVTGMVLAAGWAAGESKRTLSKEPAALTCSLSNPAKVERGAELRAKFFPAVTRMEELDSGYAFEFAGKDADLVLDFVAFERDCCTFFSFAIEIAPKNGPVRLTMSGPEGTKEFLNTAFAEELKNTVGEKSSTPAPKKTFIDKCCDALGI